MEKTSQQNTEQDLPPKSITGFRVTADEINHIYREVNSGRMETFWWPHDDNFTAQ